MDWKTIGQKVALAAPAVGTLLGGPAGAAVGALVAASLGSEPTPEAVNAALQQDPESLVKIRQIESDERVKLQELALSAAMAEQKSEIDGFALEVQDRDSARQLAAMQRDLVRPSIAFALIGGSLLLIVAMFTVGRDLMKDPTAALTIGTVIGFWFNEMKQAMAFYFGGIRDVSRQQQANVTVGLQAAMKKEK